MRALKGHGTENDFVVVPDLDGALALSPALVRALCDRRAGIGADGVLRVVRCSAEPDAAQYAGRAEYFMDYRNADGSLAEMCGNGVRVFVRYLQQAGLAGPELALATRGGIVHARAGSDGLISVVMGRPQLLAERPDVTAAPLETRASVAAVRMPNPHVVVRVTAEELDRLDLGRPPAVSPALPDGQNVEFVATLGPRHLRLRVHERGVGETRSCGTGICAAVAAVAGAALDAEPWRVDVPGGTCRVAALPDGAVRLTGPAVLVAELELDPEWLARAR